MTHYIETKTQDGALIRIEVEDTSKPSPGFPRAAASPTNVSGEPTENALNDALQLVYGVADGIVNTLQKLAVPPTSAAIDFSVKINGEVGAMVAKSRDAGQFKVVLSWKKSEPEPAKE